MTDSKCTHCGADITVHMKFCTNCGAPIDPSVFVSPPQAYIQPVAPAVPVQTIPDNAKKKTKPKKSHGVVKEVFTVLLCMLLLVCLVITGETVRVQRFLSSDNIVYAVESIDLYGIFRYVVDIVGLPEEVQNALDDIYESAGSENIVNRNIKNLLNSDDIKDFISDTVRDYISDIKNNNGNGIITPDDVIGLVKELEDEIVGVTGEMLTDADWTDLIGLINLIPFEEYSVSALRSAASFLYNATAFVFTNTVLYVFIAVDLLIILIIILLNLRRRFGMGLIHLGVVGVISGVIVYLVSYLYEFLLGLASFGLEFLKNIIFAFTSMPIASADKFALVCVIAGAAMLVVGIVICVCHRVSDKKQAANA